MSIARHVATVGAAALVSRVLGFVRDMMIAAALGAGALADAFLVAFQFVNLVRRLLAEGALNAALVPLYLRARDEGGARGAAAFAGRLIGTLAISLIVAAILFAVLMPLIVPLFAPGFTRSPERFDQAVTLARLMLPYLVFAGPLAVLMGVLNANQRFLLAASAAIAFNLTLIAALIVIQHTGDGALSARALAAAVGVAGFVQLMLVAFGILRGSGRVTPITVSTAPEIRRFATLAVPGLVASGIPQLTVIAGVMVASAAPSAVSWIYYANRLIELPLGIASMAIGTVLVPAFAHAVRSGDRTAIAAVESRGLELALGIGLPAAIALTALADPIVRTLFERGAFTSADTTATATALAAFALGLPGHVLVKAFSSVFFAREDTSTPMRAALAGFVVALVGSLALLPVLGHVGIALATALSGWTSAVLLGLGIRRRFGFSLDRDARRRLPRIGLAAFAMGVFVQILHVALAPWLTSEAATPTRLAALLVLVAGGGLLYAGALHGLGVVGLRDLMGAARRS